MSTVLIDTNVLIALIDRRDRLHVRATRDLQKQARAELHVTDAVLCEAAFALPRGDQRGRLAMLVDQLPIVPYVASDLSAHRRDVYSWLAAYAEHAPDYADGELCIAAAERRVKVWTYDSEFRTVWRTLSGHKVPLVS